MVDGVDGANQSSLMLAVLMTLADLAISAGMARGVQYRFCGGCRPHLRPHLRPHFARTPTRTP